MKWKARAIGGWISENGHWTIRIAPLSGGKMFWVYYKSLRYSPTGNFDDSASYSSARAAKAEAARVAKNWEADDGF